MGKPSGFMEYGRKENESGKPMERLKHFREFHIPLSGEERKLQGARCMECGVPFCQSGTIIGKMVSGCPLNNLIPEWNDLVYRDNLEQAAGRLLKTNNFPEFTGRVCPAPCEAACTCGLNGDSVTIKENELGIIENAFEKGYIRPAAKKIQTGKKVAVIGSGPSGLAAADQLNKRGHEVTVYERSDRPGGLLMYGIPNMKLEKAVVERRIKLMEEEGVSFVTGVDVGKSIKAEKIVKDYDSVILACGASNPRDIKEKGRDAKGIYFAVDYLKGVTKSFLDSGFQDGCFINAKGKRVVIIGGGDTGNDCVATALRQGCKSVVQLEMLPKPPVCRREDNPWPQWPKVLKVDYGQEEAIAAFGRDPRIYQTTVKEFIKDKDGNLCKIKCIELEEKRDRETGRFQMAEMPGSEYEVEADLAFIAAGFLGSQDYVAKAFGIKLDERGNVAAGASPYQSTREKVFAAGDMRRGQSLVVWAIREGREAAREVDMALMGYTNLP